MNEIWREGAVQGVGRRALWERRGAWTGVLCSRRVPAGLILAAQDWANRRGMACHAQNVTLTEKPAANNSRGFQGMASHAPTVDAEMVDAEMVFVSGWQSPVEQEIFRILRRENVPVVGVAARELSGARLPRSWREGVDAGAMAVVSPFEDAARLSQPRAAARNRWILQNCSHVVVPHAAPGGALHDLLLETLAKPDAPQIWTFAHELHAELFNAHAQQL